MSTSTPGKTDERQTERQKDRWTSMSDGQIKCKGNRGLCQQNQAGVRNQDILVCYHGDLCCSSLSAENLLGCDISDGGTDEIVYAGYQQKTN